MAKPPISTVRFLLQKNATVNRKCVDSSKPNKSNYCCVTNTNFSKLSKRLNEAKITCSGSLLSPNHTRCIFTPVRSAIQNDKKKLPPDEIQLFKHNTSIKEDKHRCLIIEYEGLIGNLIGNFKTPIKEDIPRHLSKRYEVSGLNEVSTFLDTEADPPSVEAPVSLHQFCQLCQDISNESKYGNKTSLVRDFISMGQGYRHDLDLLVKMLLPAEHKTIYNIKGKRLVNLFSSIFNTEISVMLDHLNQGDVAETIEVFFKENKNILPQTNSTLSLQEVDQLLRELSQFSKKEDQKVVLLTIAKRCSCGDLKMIVRMILHDLRIKARASHILKALGENAYKAFQESRDLSSVVARVMSDNKGGLEVKGELSVKPTLMTPVSPMLANSCKSIEKAMKKWPDGFFAEQKYDGERVQIHKKGDSMCYFSRSLKPVSKQNVEGLDDLIATAFPNVDDLILDAEIVILDSNTNKLLPFVSLRKKAVLRDGEIGLFVFDCLFINGENLMSKSLKHRREVLENSICLNSTRVNLSEIKHIKEHLDLQNFIIKVFSERLEGLVLKDIDGIYGPGKRHWLKVKKDYLCKGQMADSADLVVLGGYFGKGSNGGIISTFLMGAYDPENQRWVTVTKVGSGFDDATLQTLNSQLDLVKINKDFSQVPEWLHINRGFTPDFIVVDPKAAPVWEIMGAEFSQGEEETTFSHTAEGISIRFPRLKRMRDDKTWREATDLPRLRTLFEE